MNPTPPLRSRRGWIAGAAAGLLGAALPAWSAPGKVLVDVWKDPNCGCCGDWVRHLQANGMEVTVHETGNAAKRAQLGVALAYGSCHTAVVDGYVIEGHVPAADITRLLAQRPKALGLAVPGMPVGSPGMDGPVYAGRKDPYDVLLLAADGSASVYRSVR